MNKTEDRVLRVALMPRVSTEEQVLRGSSLDAQEEALIEYANNHNMKIVGIYRDEGHSARKPVLKRPVMLQLLEDVKAGKIDRILFIKLDRWFRNVSEYYAIQAILDQHNVTWQAILEDYNTATADGRLKVNIMLSVAENEADRTSERIKFVFNSKIAKKEIVFTLPTGYTKKMIDGVRRGVKDPETQDMMDFFFRRALATTVRRASEETNLKFNVNYTYAFWQEVSQREIYTGTYRGIENYVPAYITKDEFHELNNNSRRFRRSQNTRVYPFTGLMKCPRCGRPLVGKCNTANKGKVYMYYVCSEKLSYLCDLKQVPEIRIEQFLFENLRPEMEKFLVSAEAEHNKVKKGQSRKSEVEKLQEKLRRTNVAFFAGNMSDEEYTEQTNVIKAQIAKAQVEEAKAEKPIDTEAIKRFLATDFEGTYETLTREERKQFWHAILDEIVLEDTKPIRMVFKR